MHIPYNDENQGIPLEKTSLGEKFWQFVRFSVVTGMIFSVSFLALNFGAYSAIFADALNPEAVAKAQEILEEAAGETAVSVDPALLLPELPDKNEVRDQFSWVNMPIVPTDDRLVIPKLGKSVPLVHTSLDNLQGENWGELERQIQDDLLEGVVHYPGTAKPGQFGNVFLTGHSSFYPWVKSDYKDVFATLGKLEVGDRYYVYYNQRKYTYEITEKFEVTPDKVEVLAQPSDRKISTLMSCVPVGTTLRRLILVATQIS